MHDRRVVFSTEFLADFGQGELVSSLARYMAICRGKATLGELFLDLSWVGLILNLWQTSFWIFSTVTIGVDRIEEVLEGFLGQVEVDPLALEGGVGDDPAQVALELADVGVDLVGDEEGHALGQDRRPPASAFFLRMAMRVSMSGGLRSAIRPHSKRERKRSSRPGISLGGQSLEMTICFWLS